MFEPHNIKVFLQKFLAKYGMFFILAYIAAFAIFITILGGSKTPLFFGDIRFAIFNGYVYLPFGSAFTIALVGTLIFQVYRGLKG